MADIINDLEIVKRRIERLNGFGEEAEVIDNVISMLKAQEPILLENQHKPYGHFINANSPWVSRCPKCGKKIEGKQTRFCKYCGQAVKWE